MSNKWNDFSTTKNYLTMNRLLKLLGKNNLSIYVA